MSYKALYRKWRPQVFEDVVEQEHVVKTLKYSVSTGRIAHAYLFCGTRGTGKTTMAHILSRAINCQNTQDGNPCNQCDICKGILSGSILDVLEIDAASNNSVDNIRQIRDEVVYAPSHTKYKVYIIDEVHMLSSGAFNALLKTLEEPPKHVVFILATTEPHKLPVTILSRCQKFEFRRISVESIIERLNKIAQAQNVFLDADAARLIARKADGALRDAISLLDQCMSLGSSKILYSDVLSVIGIVNDRFIADMADAIAARNVEKLLLYVDRLVMDGKDISQFVSDFILYYRNLLICKVSKNPEEVVDASAESLETMKKKSENISPDEIVYIIKELSSLEQALKWSSNSRILLEVSLVKICENYLSSTSQDIFDRLSALEVKLNNLSFKAHQPAPVHNKNESKSSSVIPRDKTPDAKNQVKTPADTSKVRKTVSDAQSFKMWNDILKELKSMGKMVLYTNLLDTKAVELDNGALGIIFGEDKAFNKMLVSKAENIEVIKNIISKKLGKQIEVKCLDQDSVIYAKRVPKSENDALVQKAKKLAEKLDVPLNIIDE